MGLGFKGLGFVGLGFWMFLVFVCSSSLLGFVIEVPGGFFQGVFKALVAFVIDAVPVQHPRRNRSSHPNKALNHD